MPKDNRYASDWNEYSKQWKRRFGASYTHLGDEWNDDGTEVRALTSTTSRSTPSDGFFRPVATGSVDLFFSYDVFVHIAIEDTFPYTGEIACVLKPSGVSVCHYAVASTSGAWDRVEQNGWWYRGQANTMGQYYYFSPESLRRMYEHVGLAVVESHQEWCLCTIIACRLGQSLVPQLEGALRALMASAQGSDQRRAAIDEIRGLPDQLKTRLDQLVPLLESAEGQEQTAMAAQEVRRLWRGI